MTTTQTEIDNINIFRKYRINDQLIVEYLKYPDSRVSLGIVSAFQYDDDGKLRILIDFVHGPAHWIDPMDTEIVITKV